MSRVSFKRNTLATLMAGALLLAACTWRTEHKVETVHRIDAHIVLDIRQIQQEASEVEGYVRGDDDPTSLTAGEQPTSWNWNPPASATPTDYPWWAWLSFSPGARANAPELEVEVGEVTADDANQAKERRKERGKRIEAELQAHHLGENDRGYVEVRLPKDHEDKELSRKLIELAKEENKDRKTIHVEIAQRQGGELRDVLPAVEKIFAKSIRDKKLKKGHLFQAPRDKKDFETFKKGELGKKYKDAKPGAWLEK